ncbi:MAG: PAS domain S-box protein, partial [Gallionella sp.]|nr:PAS domain S-box protein [Gallionella sp.]
MNVNPLILRSRNWPVAAFLIFSALLFVAGYALKHQLLKINKAEVSSNLASIGQLKANQIRSHLDERRGDAIALANFLTVPDAHRWLAHKSPTYLPASLLLPLERVIDAHQYGGMLLLDDKANIRLGLGRYPQLSDAGKTMALGILRDRTPMAFQIYFGDPSHPEKPLLDIFVPVVNPDGSQLMGVLVIRDDLHFLYQLINSWPGESKTAESLLVTRDGNDVLFLNELRHKKNTALKLRIALNKDIHTPGWPAIRVAQGYTGFLEVKDYQGKAVLAYTLPVQDTPWGMVVKVEMNEVLERITRLQFLAWIITGLLMALSACAALLWWYKQESDQKSREKLTGVLDNLHKREIMLAKFKHTLDQVHDCIFMFSPDTLRFTYVNHGAVAQVGYSDVELLQMTPLEIKPAYSEAQFRAMLQPLLNGESPSLTFETIHRHKDGHTMPVEVYIQAVRQEDNTLICVDLVRDITERKLAEAN